MNKINKAINLRRLLFAVLVGLLFSETAFAQDATFDNLTVNYNADFLSDQNVQGSSTVDGGLYVADGAYFEDGLNVYSGSADFYVDNASIFSDDSVCLSAGENFYLYGDFVEMHGEDIELYGGDTRVFFHLSVGGGTRTGSELLYVGRHDTFQPDVEADPRIVVENKSAQVGFRDMFSLINNGGSRFSLTDTNLDSSWFFSSNPVGNFNISLEGTGGTEFQVQKNGRVIIGPGGAKNFDLRPNGNLHLLGTLYQSSDRNLKEKFEEVELETILDKIDHLPVTTWQFKASETGNRHMGPTAQDFYVAFELGKDDKTIAPVDGVGVAIAGIKALSKQDKEKDAQIKELSQELEAQKDLIKQLSERLSSLESASEDAM